ncbi:MAG: hypothetical protein IPP71_13405 [Bacteroidetes bacterium]|nr:hypothetical protein [Bacteroidota bacterium]
MNKLGPGSNRAMALSQLTQGNPYVIVHEGDTAWQLNDYKLNNDNTAITGDLKPLPNERYSYKKVNPNATNIAQDSNAYPFDEMHVKVTGLIKDSTGKVVLHNDSIKEIQVYNKINYKKKNAETTAATVGIGVGLTILIILGTIALIALILALGVNLMKDILSGD